MQEDKPFDERPDQAREDGHIAFDNLANTRDLGYLRTGHGQRILPRKLLRSSHLDGASKRDILMLLNEYNLTTVIDLRTKEEQQDHPDPKDSMPKVRFIDAPILSFATMGITREEVMIQQETTYDALLDNTRQLMSELYPHMLLNETGIRGLSLFFEVLAEHDEGAVLWHCSAGKDRAGLATALLLHVFEVPDDAILADYLATNNYMESRIDAYLGSVPAESLSPQLVESIRILNSADEAFLTTGFDALKKEYGSVDNYLKDALGVDKALKELLRKKYLA